MNNQEGTDGTILYWRDDDYDNDNDYSYALSPTISSSSSVNLHPRIQLPTMMHFNEAALMWDAITRKIEKIKKTVEVSMLIRVFVGGEKSVQRDGFHISICNCCEAIKRKYGVRTKIETMDTKTLAHLRLTPSQLMDWLIEAHMHFVTSHAHQGLRSHALAWDMQDYVQQLQRLQFHVGFPSGDQVFCPVFTQDKYQYLRHLGDMANNTFVVPLTPDGEYDDETLAEITRYIIALIIKTISSSTLTIIIQLLL